MVGPLRALPLLACLAGSVGLHAAGVLLAGPGPASRGPGAGVRPAAALTLVAARPAPGGAAVAERVVPPVQTRSSPPVPPSEPVSPAPEAPAGSDLPPAAPEPPAEPAPPPETRWEEEYLPRRELQQPPVPQSWIELAWPEGDDAPPAGRYEDVVSLFIDEEGLVRRVRIEGHGLPARLQDEVVSAFSAARFTPGRLADRPVKAWLKLAVSFDADARVSPRGAR